MSLLEEQIPYKPSCPSVSWSVSWSAPSVSHYFLKVQQVILPSFYRRTCLHIEYLEEYVMRNDINEIFRL